MWLRAWVNAVDDAGTRWPEAFHLSQSRGLGLFMMGGSAWRDYAVTSTITPQIGSVFRSGGARSRLAALLRVLAHLESNSPDRETAW